MEDSQNTSQKVSAWRLIWPVLCTFIIPLLVAYVVYPSHLPPGFGVFPPQFVAEAPGFSWLAFGLVSIGVIWISTMLLFPRWYGFKGATPAAAPAKAALPWWFYAGLVGTIAFWALMWSHSTLFGELVYWSFTPLWWSFIFVLDGVVYHRNAGRSLASTRPWVLLVMGLVSVLGWAYFEFFDYFVLGNWYYPYADKAPWDATVRTFEFLLTYSTVTPVIIQWYNLLTTYPRLVARYKNGPAWNVSGNVLMWIGFILIGLMVIWPYPLFWVVWIGPFAVMTGILLRLNIWDPFTDIAKGDWSAGLLIGLASLLNGLFWEFWNHGSMVFVTDTYTNPNYWVYDIPYVDVIHLFSEMPLLGYFGYIPFGVLVWQVYLWAAALFNFNPSIMPLGSPQVSAPQLASPHIADASGVDDVNGVHSANHVDR